MVDSIFKLSRYSQDTYSQVLQLNSSSWLELVVFTIICSFPGKGKVVNLTLPWPLLRGSMWMLCSRD